MAYLPPSFKSQELILYVMKDYFMNKVWEKVESPQNLKCKLFSFDLKLKITDFFSLVIQEYITHSQYFSQTFRKQKSGKQISMKDYAGSYLYQIRAKRLCQIFQ